MAPVRKRPLKPTKKEPEASTSTAADSQQSTLADSEPLAGMKDFIVKAMVQYSKNTDAMDLESDSSESESDEEADGSLNRKPRRKRRKLKTDALDAMGDVELLTSVKNFLTDVMDEYTKQTSEDAGPSITRPRPGRKPKTGRRPKPRPSPKPKPKRRR